MSEVKQVPVPSGFKEYEDGKHRRYNLLFAVNGAAFALAKLFTEPRATALLGNLTIQHLAVGMIAFSVLMGVDIGAFGMKMRKYVPDVFQPVGIIVLILMIFLICMGWGLVAFRLPGR
jgi:hypothetical protein